MNTQENLQMASVLGHTAASLLAQPRIGTATVELAVEGLIIALTNKARSLLSCDEIKVSVEVGPSLEAMQRAARSHLDGQAPDIVLGENETMIIRGDGDVTIVGDVSIGAAPLSMQVTDGGRNPNYTGNDSDCSTNNRGVPELLGACDCKTCGQTDTGQTGEYPCKTCGVPLTHDEQAAPPAINTHAGFTSEELHRYLRKEASEGKIDHVLRAVTSGLDEAQFYIHPLNADGDTVQFAVTRI